jgi:hypothetical protein
LFKEEGSFFFFLKKKGLFSRGVEKHWKDSTLAGGDQLQEALCSVQLRLKEEEKSGTRLR